MATRLKAAATVSAQLVQSQDELITAIARIGELQRETLRMKADADDRISHIKQTLGHGVEPLSSEIDSISKSVQAYCETNRDRLTNNGKTKTVPFITGEVSWRIRPPSVGVRDADGVIDTLLRMGLERLVRHKQEINKEAILNDPQAVKGIAGLTIKAGVEDFVVLPYDSGDVAEAA
jgi:phage host-nuclease inhibitor protein Gam